MSIINIYLSKSANQLSNSICDQLNLLYSIDFLVTIIDFRSYYNAGDKSAMGYQLAVCTTLLDLVLIVIVINEARLAPTKPVVTESVSEDNIYVYKSTFV